MSASRIPFAARTDVGQRRAHNEDAVVAELPLIAVADGVGGSAKGEVASQLALDTLVEHIGDVSTARTSHDAVRAMESAVLAANSAVHEAQLRDETLHGMATTITAAVIRDGGEIIVGHVGDSRLYIVSAAGARMATDDHSVVAELVRSGRLSLEDAAHHPQRNVITRALGPEADVTVDAFVAHVGPGDWLLACSDGLTEHVVEGELARALLEHPKDPETATQRLVDQANARGGTDNITVVVAQPVPSDVSGELRIEHLHAAAATTAQIQRAAPDAAPSSAHAEESGPLPSVQRDVETSGELPALQPIESAPYVDPTGVVRTRGTRRVIAAVLVIMLAVGAGAFLWSQSYFLIEREDGRVGINRGFPFLRLASPHRSSDVDASELSASDRERLVESHRILSRDDAERVLADLPSRIDSIGPTDKGSSGGDATTP